MVGKGQVQDAKQRGRCGHREAEAGLAQPSAPTHVPSEFTVFADLPVCAHRPQAPARRSSSYTGQLGVCYVLGPSSSAHSGEHRGVTWCSQTRQQTGAPPGHWSGDVSRGRPGKHSALSSHCPGGGPPQLTDSLLQK